MELGQWMSDNEYEPDLSFKGFAVVDNWVTAVALKNDDTIPVEEYHVAALGIKGVDQTWNPKETTETYMYTGEVTLKTSSAEEISLSGTRYYGDELQDMFFDLDMTTGTGEDVIRPYVRFSLLTGEGHKCKGSILVNSEGNGTAGNSAEIDVVLKQTTKPVKYTWGDSFTDTETNTDTSTPTEPEVEETFDTSDL